MKKLLFAAALLFAVSLNAQTVLAPKEQTHSKGTKVETTKKAEVTTQPAKVTPKSASIKPNVAKKDSTKRK